MKLLIFLSIVFPFFVLSVTAQTAFRHLTTTSNTTRNITLIDDSPVSLDQNALLFILPVWDKKTEPFYCLNYALNAGVQYDQSKKQWAIVNQDLSKDIPVNMVFNVLVVPKPTNYCFSVTCDPAAKTANAFPNGMVITNPITDNNPNVLLLVTQNVSKVYNNNSQMVAYSNGKWRISNNNYFFPVCDGANSDMPIGAKFNVLVIDRGKNEIAKVPDFPQAVAFLHQATHIPPAANIEYVNQHVSRLSGIETNPLASDENTLIFATANWGWTQNERPAGIPLGNIYTNSPLVAWISRFNHKWALANATALPLQEGTLINVVAVKGK